MTSGDLMTFKIIKKTRSYRIREYLQYESKNRADSVLLSLFIRTNGKFVLDAILFREI